ncbi:MAG: glycosyltransferase [Verrucomicrobiota bacterium JB023]|nr:glycosyltransferase [Verrucomicrobiota bacterium JB023]
MKNMKSEKFSVGVILPSYKRPEDLRTCLKAFTRQTLSPNEIVVVYRDTDQENFRVIQEVRDSVANLRPVAVTEPGLACAMTRGLNHAKSDIVAFTDDDAIPDENWIEEIHAFFQKHPEAGGVGGRDRLVTGLDYKDRSESKSVFGKLDLFGKFHGNHHCPPVNELTEIHYPKGVNMAWRRELISGLDISEGMAGEGTVLGTEMLIGYYVKAQKFRNYFSKNISVLHNCGKREKGDERDHNLHYDSQVRHNQYFTVSRYGPRHRLWLAFLRTSLVGGSRHPGFLVIPFLFKKKYKLPDWKKMQRSAVQGWSSGLERRGRKMEAKLVGCLGKMF